MGGVRSTERTYHLHALLYHQAGACLEPIDTGSNGDLRNVECIWNGVEIERNLDTTRHDKHLLSIGTAEDSYGSWMSKETDAAIVHRIAQLQRTPYNAHIQFVHTHLPYL